MGSAVPFQALKKSSQILRDMVTDKPSFKEILFMGLDQEKKGFFKSQIMGLGLEQEVRGIIRSPSDINQAQMSKMDTGLTHDEFRQNRLNKKSFGPSMKEYNKTKAQSGEITEGPLLGKGQHSEEMHGLKVTRRIGLTENRSTCKNKFYALNKIHEEGIWPQNLIQDSSTANDFISEGNISLFRQTVNEVEGVYSDPGVDSVLSKRISRRKTGRKPKRKEDFRVGKIRKWNEFYTGREKKTGNVQVSMVQGDGSSKNKRFEGRVYSRRSKSKEKWLAKGKGQMRPLERHFQDNWKELEEQFIDSCQSSFTSSSENFESDKEAFEIEEVDSDKEREAGEEEGYVGMRLLLGTQDMEATETRETRILDSQELDFDGQSTYERKLDEVTKGPLQSVQIGKVGVTWDEIQRAGGILNLKLIERGSFDATKSVEDKGERSTTRRRGIERELHNLNFNINYEKGSTERGLSGVK